jgi:thioredoxin 1
MMEPDMVELSDSNFDEETAGRDGILLFYKTICPFCKTLEAVIGKFHKAYPNVNLYRLEFEQQIALAERFQIERAPTLFVLKNGQVAATKTGLMNPKELKALYQQA